MIFFYGKNNFVSQLQDNSWLSKKIKIPLTEHQRTCKGSFKFLPPKDVQEIGSFYSGTALKPHPIVDLVLTIPKVHVTYYIKRTDCTKGIKGNMCGHYAQSWVKLCVPDRGIQIDMF